MVTPSEVASTVSYAVQQLPQALSGEHVPFDQGGIVGLEPEVDRRALRGGAGDGDRFARARVRGERESKQKRRARNFRDVRGNWLRPHAGPGAVTLAIMAFCGIVFVASRH